MDPNSPHGRPKLLDRHTKAKDIPEHKLFRVSMHKCRVNHLGIQEHITDYMSQRMYPMGINQCMFDLYFLQRKVEKLDTELHTSKLNYLQSKVTDTV